MSQLKNVSANRKLPGDTRKTETRILVVEDEQIVALDLQERLEELGYSVPTIAVSGVQALEMVENTGPDLILMDIHLQGNMDGVEVADRIREKYDLPVVYLTAYSDESTLQRARFTEPFGYLVKPFDMENVQSTIELALYRHQLDCQLKDNAQFLSILNEIARTALETSGVSTVAQVAVDQIQSYFLVDSCYLYQWDDDSQQARLAAGSFKANSTTPVQYAHALDRLCEVVLETNQPLLIEDVATDDTVWLRNLGLDFARSVFSLPLTSGDNWLGALIMLNLEPRDYSLSEYEHGKQIALHVSLALAEAQLVENLEVTVLTRTREIKQEKEKSEIILRNVNQAILMTDQDLIIRYVNPAFTELTGYTEDDALGLPAGSIGAGANSKDLAAAIRAAFQRREGWHGEVVGQRKDGRIYDAALALSPVFDGEGSLIGVVSSQQDISLQRNLERARARFMHSVSHELRTPITSILLYTHLLGAMEDIPENSARHLNILENQVNRLKMLVEDTLEITDLDSGQALDTWEPIPIPYVVREVVDGFREQAEEAGLSISLLQHPEDIPVVMGDQIRLGQALAEIMDNAINFTPVGGQVDVRIRTMIGAEISGLAIEIQDNGFGISSEELESVFDRFFRGGHTEDGDRPGTGLGLSIAQEIVKAHGGKITVQSVQGEGSVFSVWLPAATDSSYRRE